MRKLNNKLLQINSISAMHRLTGLADPVHPLISVSRCSEMRPEEEDRKKYFILNLYTVAILPDFKGQQFGYGTDHYDFKNGTLCFVAPGHLIKGLSNFNTGGIFVCFHPDLIRHSELAKTIKQYEFFSYAVNEAIQITFEEEAEIIEIMRKILRECLRPEDCQTQNVMIAYLDLLLNFCHRFFSRQYKAGIKNTNNLIIKLETLIENYFNSGKRPETGIPTVQSVSEHLYVSPTYLSDVVRSITGMNTQQYIHNKLIDRAKVLLCNNELHISEIAYLLGFDYPQSFNKLFKKKLNISPMAYRKSLA